MAIFLAILASVLVIFLSFYLYSWTYWLRRGIPGPLGFPIFGNLLNHFHHEEPLGLKLQEFTKKYGKVFGITEGLRQTLVISDVEMINEVFVKQFDNFYGRKLSPLHGDPENDERVSIFISQGHRWKRLRNLSSPTFSSASLRKLLGTVEDSVFQILDVLEKKGGDQIDMLEIYQEFTLDVIGRIAMGQEGSKIFENPLFSPVRQIFGKGNRWLFTILSVLPKPLALMIRKRVMQPSEASKNPAVIISLVIQKAVSERIRQRKEQGAPGEPEDFIDLFLDAQSEIDIKSEKNEEFLKANIGKIDRKLSMDEIIAQCFVFIVAGFDTTALSLAFSTWLLTRNPEKMRKAQEEIDEICTDANISFDQIAKLKYLDNVAKEALRLYPLAGLAVSRKCMKSTEVCGIRIEKDTNIQVDTWSVHYDKQIWGEDSNEFRPERWNDQQMKNGANYLPFGFGPRQCIGMRLAMMEEKLILAHILRKFDFEIGSKTQIPLKLVGRATTQPETLVLKLRKRDY
ncbi:unnamed protein product [Caenorhabditis angaria]|uniref:Cytochrome P450 n=1 Tax=Caenorhabditis angaria TaxID=860376 RepID=A0A9P1I9D2_9PELO|nr:unnamed protein product [Caenorhabditis angaria]